MHGPAFCVLEEPVKEIPIAPILYGCEMEALKEKAVIWLAGFGKNDNSSCVKHRVETHFVEYRNAEKKDLVVGSNGETACNGDSGGPAYSQLEDGTWRTFGITSHGIDASCTKVAYYTNAEIMVPWMQEEIKKAGDDHIDVTPCFDDDGNWNPSEQCGGFAKDYEPSYGSWDKFCSEGAPARQISDPVPTPMHWPPPLILPGGFFSEACLWATNAPTADRRVWQRSYFSCTCDPLAPSGATRCSRLYRFESPMRQGEAACGIRVERLQRPV